jgi:N-acetylneuraminic acid mutarotase
MPGWLPKTSLPTPRHDLCAVAVGDLIYAISGADDETLNVVEMYDASSDTWSEGPVIPTPRGWAGSVLLDGRIYVIGGKTVRTPEEKPRTGYDGRYTVRVETEALDLSTHTWVRCAPLREPKAGLTVTTSGGLIYALGGNNMEAGHLCDTVEIYDPARNVWSIGPPLPRPLQGATSTCINERIYLTGGLSEADKSQMFRDETYRLDPTTGHWESLTPLPTPRCSLASVVVGRTWYTFGGRNPAGCYHDCVEIYDVDTDTWTRGVPLPEKKAWLGAAAVKDRIFVLGGANKGLNSDYQWLDSVHEYRLESSEFQAR